MIGNLQRFQIIFILLLAIPGVQHLHACSMYKITVGDKTMIGTNADTWRTTPRIWFENGKSGEYGACYTGSRRIGNQKFAAQSGMNEWGLCYSRLTAYHPVKKEMGEGTRKTIDNPDLFLIQSLHTCKNVQEVHDLFLQYDHSIYIEDVFIFVEPSGKYLIVEPYSLDFGSDPTYVLSNFCPSITPENKRRSLDRYKKGVDYVQTGADTSLEYCTALSKEMHVCRDHVGDGTLLTSIWDSKNGEVNLFFYHDYSEGISFNLEEELSKGDHLLEIPPLFPPNEEFERLGAYITPFNTPWIRIGLTLLGCFFGGSSLLLLIGFFRNKHRNQYRYVFLGASVLCALMFGYMIVLVTNINVFYFQAPYEHFASKLISASSYLPFLLLASMIPLLIVNYKILKGGLWKGPLKYLLTANNGIFIGLIGLFCYWGFYAVW